MATVIRITKAVLADQLATAVARVSQLEVQLVAERSDAAHQRALYVRLNQRHARAVANDALVTVAPVKVAKVEQKARILYAMPQWQVERALSMAAAKAQAVYSNQTVKV